eukprot:6345958-Amphidinium_carterae.1
MHDGECAVADTPTLQGQDNLPAKSVTTKYDTFIHLSCNGSVGTVSSSVLYDIRQTEKKDIPQTGRGAVPAMLGKRALIGLLAAYWLVNAHSRIHCSAGALSQPLEALEKQRSCKVSSEQLKITLLSCIVRFPHRRSELHTQLQGQDYPCCPSCKSVWCLREAPDTFADFLSRELSSFAYTLCAQWDLRDPWKSALIGKWKRSKTWKL